MVHGASVLNVPTVDEGQCQACVECLAIAVCRVKALRVIDAGECPFVDAHLCHGCLICVPACRFQAITV
ncbi:MAG: 4Fe-4S binding protein [Chloroflexi bacterium]|nr:4Fe-4S binding protein [Chloroflexota bacterium]